MKVNNCRNKIIVFSLGFLVILFIAVIFSNLSYAGSIQVNLNITSGGGGGNDSGGGGGDGGGGGGTSTSPISGCMDPLATNYNPGATVDDGSCQYASTPIPNVSGFTALFNTPQKYIELFWTNPNFNKFEAVRIIRKINSIPTDENDGQLIYQDGGNFTINNNLPSLGTYFYVAFVKSTNGDYSSGAIASVIISNNNVITPPDNKPPSVPGCLNPSATNYNPLATVDDGSCQFPAGPGCTDQTAINYNPLATIDDDSCQYRELPLEEKTGSDDPFSLFPETANVDPQIQVLSLTDFTFYQAGEQIQLFGRQTSIRLNGQKNFIVSIDYNKLPEVLKNIGVSIYDPVDHNKVFSFLLRLNEDKTRYEANIGPLDRDGVYLANIYIINFSDQTLKRIAGSLIVSGTGPVSQGVLVGVGKKILSPLAIGSGIAVGVAQTVLVTSGVMSLTDFYLLFLKGIGALLGFLGIKRRHKPWGTVYDSVTKRPIDPAYVSLHTSDNEQKELASAITDIDGRYGFFLKPGVYKMKAGKTHYEFPSKTLAGRDKDELYSDLYFGEPIESRGEEVINKNIPLDPIGFDWNEFIKGKSEFFKVFSKKEVHRARIFSTIYGVGLAATFLSMIFAPGIINLSMMGIYIILFIFPLIWKYRHKVVTVKWVGKAEPIPFAIIRFFLSDLNQEVKHVVADNMGRFYVLVRPGTYYFTVEEKQADSTYKKVYQSETLELKKGVLEKDILIHPTPEPIQPNPIVNAL